MMRKAMLAALTFLTAPALSDAETLDGTVTYRERMMLPPNSVLEITLEDVSRADAPARVLTRHRIEDPGTPPFRFSIDYDPAVIDPSRSYALRASVRQNERLLMTTDTTYPVLTRGADDGADLLLKLVGAPAPDADLIDTFWKLEELGGAEVTAIEGKQDPHLVFLGDGGYSATVGCNMLRGSVEIGDGTVDFGPAAMTMMACPPPLDEIERSFAKALGAAAGYRITGETLELLDSSDMVLARFHVVHL
ncbi:YbaY family lipoprotein [Tropicimonas sp. IMCC6043]|uniref:YbaY family lipoprotein n=1 Tax=Tropicimonas sp. IMCC6043 TaxID=2510645 RepID=UPI00101B5B44|nr:YbaY family lipoprotein [Tropicimonas sp. IMCC6043]RYH12097.1 META domain-containing protein [Tropicimonas sp. IMCC6043]